jgi:actin-related protein 8
MAQQALQLASPQELGYVLRWPIHGTQFNQRDYSSQQLIMSDIETILRVTLKEKLEIDTQDYKVIRVLQEVGLHR